MKLSIDGLGGLLGIPWLIAVFFVLQCIVILALALAVKNDAESMQRSSGLFLITPWFWFFVVLLAGGYLPSLAYWLIHYSSLKSRHEEKG
jgi:hypothetical protein